MGAISDEDLETTMQLLLEKVEKVVQSRDHGDVKELLQADRDLETLETSVKNLERRIRQHVAAQTRQRNELLPIHRLPPELLSRIFFLALQTRHPPLRSRGYFVHLGFISRVSWRWNAFAQSPNLHGFLSSQCSSSRLSRCLSKSKDSALDVICIGSPRKFQDLALQYVSRWRSLELDGCSEKFVKRVMESPTPQLNDLRMVDHHWPPVFIPHDKLGRLRHLVLKNAPIHWEGGGVLKDLQTFEFEQRSYQVEGFPPASRLFSTLEASPRMTTLALESPASDYITNIDPGVIQLQHLKSLSLRLPGRVIHHILAHIRIPNCTQLHIATKQGRHDILDESTTHMTAVISSVLAGASDVAIEVDVSSVMFTASRPESPNYSYSGPSLRISVEAKKPEPILRWFNEVIETVQPRLPVHLRVLTPETAHVLPILSTTCPITELHVVDLAVPSNYIKFLSQTNTSSGVTRWRLPNLKMLYFDDCDPDAGGLIRMLRSRYGPFKGGRGHTATKNKGKKKVLDGQHLVPLDTLGITGVNSLDEEDFEALEDIVGAGNVDWDDPTENDYSV